MTSEVRVIETPGFDTDYWLCRCEGFQVDRPEGRLGIVEWLIFRSRHDRPDALALRTGRVLHRSLLVAVSEVESVIPAEQRITLGADPVPIGRVQGLRRRRVGALAGKVPLDRAGGTA